MIRLLSAISVLPVCWFGKPIPAFPVCSLQNNPEIRLVYAAPRDKARLSNCHSLNVMDGVSARNVHPLNV